MSQLLNQPGLFYPDRAGDVDRNGDAKLPSEVKNDASLPPGVSLILIASLSATLWTGIFFLAGDAWHYVSHLV